MISIRDMKFCTDCRWSRDAGSTVREYVCWHEEVTLVSPVDGSETHPRCDVVRSLKGQCGKEGRLWEPRPDRYR